LAKKYRDEHFNVYVNNTDIVELVGKNIINFQRKFDNKAYLHWYSKFGVEEDDLKYALENNYQILDNYPEMTSLN